MNRIGFFVFKFFDKRTSNTTIKKLLCKKCDKKESYIMSFSIGCFRYYSSHLEVPEPTPTKIVTSGLEPISAKDLDLFLSRIINWEFDWLAEKGSFSSIKLV